MPVYEPKYGRLEAVKLTSGPRAGQYLVDADGEPEYWEGETFEMFFGEAEDQRATKDRRATRRSGGERRGRGGKKAAAAGNATAPKNKGGRKPSPWHCTKCDQDTAGKKCTHCGASKRTAAAAAAAEA